MVSEHDLLGNFSAEDREALTAVGLDCRQIDSTATRAACLLPTM